jgi:uncharacterized protein YbaR (Trm112 family)
MSVELICPICEADIPLDGDEESGDLLMCSYCKMTLKMLKTKDKWTLVEDFDEYSTKFVPMNPHPPVIKI